VAELLRTVPLAYQAIRYAGAAYLIYLGGCCSRGACAKTPPSSSRPLFFLAFLPQFINPHGSAFRQTVTLGLFFDASGTCVNIAVALAASKAGAFLPARMRYVTGGVFIALGLRLAIPERV